MREAIVMCQVLFVLMVYRKLMQVSWIQNFLHYDMPISAFFFQYYTILLGAILAVLLDTAVNCALWFAPIFSNPEAVAQSLNQTLSGIPGMTTEQAESWQKVLYIDSSLQQAACFAPVAVLATFGIVAFHVMHLVGDHDVNNLSWFPSKRQDWVLQVIMLPAMYAILALRSMIRALEVMTGSGWAGFLAERPSQAAAGSSWVPFVNYSKDMYQANFAVANFAEMYTLWCFSLLCLDLLKRGFRSKENYLAFSCVTMQGVDGFVLCGLCKVAVEIALSFKDTGTSSYEHAGISIVNQGDDLFQDVAGTRIDLTYCDSFLKVLLVLSSLQCLYNVTVICWMSELADINPSMKFFGTRALVLFAQCQPVLLDFASDSITSFKYSPAQVRLMHASLMCYECFFVSLMHIVSWPPEDFECGYVPLEDDDYEWQDTKLGAEPSVRYRPTVRRDPSTGSARNRRNAGGAGGWSSASTKLWANVRGGQIERQRTRGLTSQLLAR